MSVQVSVLEAELPSYAASCVSSLPVASKDAMVVALHGDLGAGKTTFVQALARVLGVTDTVTSPTFVIQKQYATTHERFARLLHIDAYRLETPEELVRLGFAEQCADPEQLICIEWAERVAPLLPAHTVHYTFAPDGVERRTITIDAPTR